ncbi:hypothetical protein CP8484711_1843, partial [Chlamydia psittaci 84-8471/1]
DGNQKFQDRDNCNNKMLPYQDSLLLLIHRLHLVHEFLYATRCYQEFLQLR